MKSGMGRCQVAELIGWYERTHHRLTKTLKLHDIRREYDPRRPWPIHYNRRVVLKTPPAARTIKSHPLR